MDEEKKPDEAKPAEAAKPAEGSSPSADDPIKRAEDAVKNLKAENDRADAIRARQVLSGSAEAGQEIQKPKVETKEEQIQREAKEIMATIGR